MPVRQAAGARPLHLATGCGRSRDDHAGPARLSARRHARSRPLVDELHTFLHERRAKLSGKSETAKAIDYSLKRWEVFTRFIDDGRLCMSEGVTAAVAGWRAQDCDAWSGEGS
ncbi:IS66 family transposase [Bradyrhizobium diazoefficiens]|uniref:IS66 family transposase n=1 Tax=Bradyrhizobium diazoefficiens TaxID=1355477 RepID=UPI001FEE21DD|nr:IS66 family transposase [Bradyrhizobium sp. LCT2]